MNPEQHFFWSTLKNRKPLSDTVKFKLYEKMMHLNSLLPHHGEAFVNLDQENYYQRLTMIILIINDPFLNRRRYL